VKRAGIDSDALPGQTVKSEIGAQRGPEPARRRALPAEWSGQHRKRLCYQPQSPQRRNCCTGNNSLSGQIKWLSRTSQNLYRGSESSSLRQSVWHPGLRASVAISAAYGDTLLIRQDWLVAGEYTRSDGSLVLKGSRGALLARKGSMENEATATDAQMRYDRIAPKSELDDFIPPTSSSLTALRPTVDFENCLTDYLFNARKARNQESEPGWA
jgi:hypothetical protein